MGIIRPGNMMCGDLALYVVALCLVAYATKAQCGGMGDTTKRCHIKEDVTKERCPHGNRVSRHFTLL